MATREKSHAQSTKCPFCGKWFKGIHTKEKCSARLSENKNYKIIKH